MNSMPLALISAQVIALHKGMENVINGTTPDHAKWSGVNSFIKKYNELAQQYVIATGQKSIRLYDVDNLKNPHSLIWPDQKGMFDTIFTDVLILKNMLTYSQSPSIGPLYNLFVSGDKNDWTGKPFKVDSSRCIREYTITDISRRLGQLDTESIKELKLAPCIFAYETEHNMSPKFGHIRDIVNRQGEVRVEYEIQPVDPFLTANDLLMKSARRKFTKLLWKQVSAI